MRHGRKSSSRRFDGHKMDLITDEASELVLGVDVRAGNASDGQGAMPLLDQVQSMPGVSLDTLVGDMAYSDGDIRAGAEARGVDLVAKVPPVTNGGRYPKTDFYIDLDRGEITCPAGEVTTAVTPSPDHKGRPGLLFRFDPAECATCPLRADCTPAISGRTVFVGVHHQRLAAARAAQHDPEIVTLLRDRAKVERKIDHLQDLGMRKARYRGRRKTKHQGLMAATVANISRLDILGALGQTANRPGRLNLPTSTATTSPARRGIRLTTHRPFPPNPPLPTQPINQRQNRHFVPSHLAEDLEATEGTKGRFRFPYGDFEKVNRAALIHAKQRASQNDHDDIAKAADRLLEALDAAAS